MFNLSIPMISAHFLFSDFFHLFYAFPFLFYEIYILQPIFHVAYTTHNVIFLFPKMYKVCLLLCLHDTLMCTVSFPFEYTIHTSCKVRFFASAYDIDAILS